MGAINLISLKRSFYQQAWFDQHGQCYIQWIRIRAFAWILVWISAGVSRTVSGSFVPTARDLSPDYTHSTAVPRSDCNGFNGAHFDRLSTAAVDATLLEDNVFNSLHHFKEFFSNIKSRPDAATYTTHARPSCCTANENHPQLQSAWCFQVIKSFHNGRWRHIRQMTH